MRRAAFVLLALASVVGAESKERWIYLPANFQVAAETDRICGLLERAAASGYHHALVQDSKFAHLASVSAEYRPNVAKAKATAKRLKVKIVPALFPVGYSNDLLFNDPDLAEGLPVKDALIVLKDGIARVVADPPVALPDRWGFADESLVAEVGGTKSGPTAANARLHSKVRVAPFRQYRLSVEIRTAGLSGGKPEIKALGGSDRSLQWSNVTVQPTEDWTRADVTFNSLDNAEVSIYFGIWGGHKGIAWWRGARIEECGPVNLVRREGAPLVVEREGGETLREGADFEPLTDPRMGSTPWPGAYTPWHEPPALRVKSLADGEKLRVSYFHAHVIHDEQVCGCAEEPAFRELLLRQAGEVVALWESRTNFMSHDEWRVLGWDAACARTGKTPGRIAADNLRFCTGLLRERVPDGRILVWNDMFDPFHNAVDRYYLANGSLEGSWDGLDPSVEVMNWNFGKRDESLAFFAKRGNPQVIAGFYDGDLKEVDAWLASAAKTGGVRGFMYTTWRQDYSRLAEVAKILDRAGW